MMHFDFVLMRTPLQSLSLAYNKIQNCNELFHEGVYLASPEFWNEYRKESETNLSDKIGLTLTKYWIRSCSRCTPYGTFAGSSVVDINDEETKVQLNDDDCHTKYRRLDMDCIAILIKSLEALPAIQQQVKLYPNNSIYELKSSYRYAEYVLKNNRKIYKLTSVEKTKYLSNVLSAARDGATIDTLVTLLVDQSAVCVADAREFIVDIWMSQLLVSELEPSVTGEDPLLQIIQKLARFKNIDAVLTTLNEVRGILCDSKGSITDYAKVEIILNKLIAKQSLPKNLFQTDLFFSADYSNINKTVIESILTQMGDLMVLSLNNTRPELEEFKRKFKIRFGDQEVPLGLALDNDLGLGYPVLHEIAAESEWINDIVVKQQTATSISGFDFVQKLSILKYDEYLKGGHSRIEIMEDDLKTLNQKPLHSCPASMFLMGSLLKKNGVCDVENYYFDINYFSGPSGANLLGRFAHGNSRLCELARKVLKDEELENPDVIYAEVCHLPESRLGNVLLRPLLRDYEIPYVGKSGATAGNQIEINDLTIRIVHSQIVLHSKKHKKRVMPRLTTAHNYTRGSMPIYRFLCDLQSQDLSIPRLWDWGHLSVIKHLPRVTYKNLILKKAYWRIEENDLVDLKSSTDILNYFKRFTERLKLPQRVVYKEGDNQLLIDFRFIEGIRIFLHYLSRYKEVILEEFLFSEDNCIVNNRNGDCYTNEIILPIKTNSFASKVLPYSKSFDNKIKTRFFPGGEWCYFKLYCGIGAAEKLLRHAILPFVEKHLEDKSFEKFFFVRYQDDLPHIRIRFFNSDIDRQVLLQREFMKSLMPYVEEGVIGDITMDTYSRETERYRPELIEETEALFYNDSLAVLRFIDLLDNEHNLKYKILFSLRAIDIFLNDWRMSISEKKKLLEMMSATFLKEFGGDMSLQKIINLKYKNNQRLIFSHMDENQDGENEIEHAVEVFQTRSQMNAPYIAAMLREINNNTSITVFELLPSFLHMFVNRMFIGQQRKYELVIYNMLERYYSSQIALNKQRPVTI